MRDNLLTVTELNEYLRAVVESQPLFTDVWVRGEISNFTNHRSGHFYFSLKDENCLVRAVMFRSYAQQLPFLPETGMKVLAHGRVSVFPRDGQYQLYVDTMQPDGLGALYLAFEQLRRKLEAEGLFDEARKRPLPPYPARIGVVTSPTGAAVRDVIRILGRRYPLAEVTLYPALVQGPGAPESIVKGIAYFNKTESADVLIVGRGGGSAEDLWAFNNETLARAVAASAIPVISAVGHETDFTLCDFAADVRAATPSAAAELAVPDARELQKVLKGTAARMEGAMRADLTAARAALARYAAHKALGSPRYAIDTRRMNVAYLERRLCACGENMTKAPRAAFAALCAKLGALDPLAVLSRGFAAAFDENGKTVSGVASLARGGSLTLRFADGEADATVTDVRKGTKNG